MSVFLGKPDVGPEEELVLGRGLLAVVEVGQCQLPISKLNALPYFLRKWSSVLNRFSLKKGQHADEGQVHGAGAELQKKNIRATKSKNDEHGIP